MESSMEKYNCPFGGCAQTREPQVLFDTHFAREHGLSTGYAMIIAERYRALAQELAQRSKAGPTPR
jgi:hypothetical protein